MQQESKIGFLWQHVIACVHPSQYKELIRKKKGVYWIYQCSYYVSCFYRKRDSVCSMDSECGRI